MPRVIPAQAATHRDVVLGGATVGLTVEQALAAADPVVTTPSRPVPPRLALRIEEAAASIGVSDDFFREHVSPELVWVRRGRVRIVAVTELQRWLDENGERVLP